MDKSFGKSFAMLPVKQSPVAAAETKNMSLKIHGHDGILEKIIILYNGTSIEYMRNRLITMISALGSSCSIVRYIGSSEHKLLKKSRRLNVINLSKSQLLM